MQWADNKSYDVRKSTCQGGSGLWAFLSHVREVPRGDTLELTTDDAMANTDVPAWSQRMGWKPAKVATDGAQTFITQRPA